MLSLQIHTRAYIYIYGADANKQQALLKSEGFQGT